MSACKGLHCGGCGGGTKLSGGAVVAISAGVFYLIKRQQIDHAADDVITWMLVAIVVTVILAIAVAAVFAAVKIRAWRRRTALDAAPEVIVLPAAATQVISQPRTATAALPAGTGQTYSRLTDVRDYARVPAAHPGQRRHTRCAHTRNRSA